MLNKIILLSSLIIPWFTLFFLPKDAIKRYFPVAVFTSLLVTITFEIAYAYQWWELLDNIMGWDIITNASFVYGMFFVGTIWIFHFTFGRFLLYFLTNVLFDGFQMFVLSRYFFEDRIYRLIRISEFEVFLIMLFISLIIYVYHKWQAGIFKDSMQRTGLGGKRTWEVRNPFRDKEKAR